MLALHALTILNLQLEFNAPPTLARWRLARAREPLASSVNTHARVWAILRGNVGRNTRVRPIFEVFGENPVVRRCMTNVCSNVECIHLYKQESGEKICAAICRAFYYEDKLLFVYQICYRAGSTPDCSWILALSTSRLPLSDVVLFAPRHTIDAAT